MFDIGIGEVFVILVVALFVFGPDRLPTMAKQAASFVRDLRTMVANARRDLSNSVGDLGIDEEDLRTLSELRNPRSFVRKKVLDGVDLGLDDLGLDDDPKPRKSAARNNTTQRNGTNQRNGSVAKPSSSSETPVEESPRFDPEAT
ncbi:Sec-independent protein translocase protein TatB [Haloactinopolyspora sp.]|uniref:Sec-independent protein translocase protein TatB n=1 Tax=Haloactinopolyspora sp. TaxID=1966353 RepID=UPI00262EA7FE|nr:Sec-independent protein translocase protein TatB [Haloactinopolyspora sp.]